MAVNFNSDTGITKFEDWVVYNHTGIVNFVSPLEYVHFYIFLRPLNCACRVLGDENDCLKSTGNGMVTLRLGATPLFTNVTVWKYEQCLVTGK